MCVNNFKCILDYYKVMKQGYMCIYFGCTASKILTDRIVCKY